MKRTCHPGTPRRSRAAALALLLCAAPVAAPAAEPPAPAPASLSSDTLWEGRVLVEGPLTVPAGVTLTIRQGATVHFRGDAGLTVFGVLRAEGSTEQPVVLSPENDGPWAGVTLAGDGPPSLLKGCRILGARALSITRGEHVVEGCDIAGGATGIEVNGDEARPVLRANRIRDLSGGGVRCLGRSTPIVEGNTIERCGPYGIHASQGAVPLVRGNAIAECVNGIELLQTAPLVRDNQVRRCERGIALSSVDGGKPIAGNTLENCGAGIFVQHIGSPEISGNTIAGNKEGVVCFMGAAPLIRNNEIRENETGVSCTQIASPTIEANTIVGNGRGVFLTLSSYALLRGNNFDRNGIHVELGNMSRDWERRVGKKPMRGLQQQSAVRAGRGLSPQGAGGGDGFTVEGGGVEASGNWWGEATTREMEQKGPDADIAGLRDWHDVPTLTYEGYEGEYVQDRIVYAPWATARIGTAGIAPPAAPGAEGVRP